MRRKSPDITLNFGILFLYNNGVLWVTAIAHQYVYSIENLKICIFQIPTMKINDLSKSGSSKSKWTSFIKS